MEEILKSILCKLESIERETEAKNREMLTVNDAAKFLNVSAPTIYALCHKRRLPHYKPNNKQLFFDRDELKSWMKRNRIEAEEQTATAAILNDYINR